MASYSPIIDIDRETGEFIQGWARCRQSIMTIVRTRIGTRLMRLWFGSKGADMQDKPGNEFEIMSAFHEIADPINTWEPEFRVSGISLDSAGADGAFSFTIDGVYLPEQSQERVQVTL